MSGSATYSIIATSAHTLYRSSSNEGCQHNRKPTIQPDLDAGIQIRIDDLTLEELAKKLDEVGIPASARAAILQQERERRNAEGAV